MVEGLLQSHIFPNRMTLEEEMYILEKHKIHSGLWLKSESARKLMQNVLRRRHYCGEWWRHKYIWISIVNNTNLPSRRRGWGRVCKSWSNSWFLKFGNNIRRICSVLYNTGLYQLIPYIVREWVNNIYWDIVTYKQIMTKVLKVKYTFW
jgi:hypothetical protein